MVTGSGGPSSWRCGGPDIDLAWKHRLRPRNHVRVPGKSIDKDTKTHRARRLAIDQSDG
ncbi:hypothetical protein HBB16_07755 [Pseudonocardia sp. MCCB 268]|nr:hypothetical protein [Pseudonocardia cytotoxica]